MPPEITAASQKFKIFAPLLKAAASADGKKHLTGVASSSVIDLHGDRMTENAITDMERAAKANLTIFLNHSYEVPEDVAGSVTEAWVTRTGDVVLLNFDIVINEENPRAVQAWNAIQGGTKLGLSIGAMIPEGKASWDKTMKGYVIDGVELLETSIVGVPANPRSWVEYARKALDGTRMLEGQLDINEFLGEVRGSTPAMERRRQELLAGTSVGHIRRGIEVGEGETATITSDAPAPAGVTTCKSCGTQVEGTFADGTCTHCGLQGEMLFSPTAVLGEALAELVRGDPAPAPHQHPHAHVHGHDHTHGYGDQTTVHSHDHAHTHSHGHPDDHEHADTFDDYQHDHYHRTSASDTDDDHAHTSGDADGTNATAAAEVPTTASATPTETDSAPEGAAAVTASQEAPVSDPGTEGNGDVALDEGLSRELAQTAPAILATFKSNRDLISKLLNELRSAIETRDAAIGERDTAIRQLGVVLSSTQGILEKIKSTPIGKRTTVYEAVSDLDHLRSTYAPEVIRMLEEANRT